MAFGGPGHEIAETFSFPDGWEIFIEYGMNDSICGYVCDSRDVYEKIDDSLVSKIDEIHFWAKGQEIILGKLDYLKIIILFLNI